MMTRLTGRKITPPICYELYDKETNMWEYTKECNNPKCHCRQLAWMEKMEKIEQEIFPDSRPRGEVFVCIPDESAGVKDEIRNS